LRRVDDNYTTRATTVPMGLMDGPRQLIVQDDVIVSDHVMHSTPVLVKRWNCAIALCVTLPRLYCDASWAVYVTASELQVAEWS